MPVLKQFFNRFPPDFRRQHGHQDGEATLPQRADGHSLCEAASADLAQEDRAEGRRYRLPPHRRGLRTRLPQGQRQGRMR